MLRTPSQAARARAAALIVAAAVAVTLPAVASAHAALLESTPRDGEVLAAAPPVAVLRFNSRIEKRLTRVVLDREGGPTVALTVAPEAPGDPPDRVSMALPALTPGSYEHKYSVLAADGHASPGLIRFEVEAAGAAR